MLITSFKKYFKKETKTTILFVETDQLLKSEKTISQNTLIGEIVGESMTLKTQIQGILIPRKEKKRINFFKINKNKNRLTLNLII